MRYAVKLSAPGIDAKIYSVEGDTREEATMKANKRFMEEYPNASQFDVKVEFLPQASETDSEGEA